MDFALRETQTRFYALDLKNLAEQFSIDDSFNLQRLGLKEADADGSLKYIVSTYDPYDQIIRDGYYPGGRKILSFVNILQHDVSLWRRRWMSYFASGRPRWDVLLK